MSEKFCYENAKLSWSSEVSLVLVKNENNDCCNNVMSHLETLNTMVAADFIPGPR